MTKHTDAPAVPHQRRSTDTAPFEALQKLLERLDRIIADILDRQKASDHD